MNPHSKPRPLFFTPRSPWGRLPLKHAHKSHMRASEGERDLPEEDKDGRWQGKIESSGGPQGRPEHYFEFQVNSNSHLRTPVADSDPVVEGREKLNRERAEAQIKKEKEKQLKEIQKQQQQSQQQVQRYVNAAMSAVDEGAAFLQQQQQQGQRKPAR